MTAPKIPRVPKTITTDAGKAMWKQIWSAKADQIVEGQDVFFITMICEATEDIARFKKAIARDDDTILINDEKTTVLHPLYKQINETTKNVTEWLRALGFSPADRAKLRAVTNDTDINPFAEMRDMVKGKI